MISDQTIKSFMQQDLTLECNSSVYIRNLGIFIWPLFTLYGLVLRIASFNILAIILPLILITCIFKAYLKKDKSLDSKYFFISAGYRKKHFYWYLRYFL